MSDSTAIGIRDDLLTQLQTIDGAATVNAPDGSISHTYNYDLSSSLTLGGDPRAGTASAAGVLDLEEIRVDPERGPLGYLVCTVVFTLRVRATPAANTADERQKAAANLASDVAAALMSYRTVNSRALDVRMAITARDGDGSGEEWTAGAGVVVVAVEVDYQNRLGV